MNLLQMTGYEKLGNRIVLASTVTNIVLNVLLIPLYGAIGAAIATSARLSGVECSRNHLRLEEAQSKKLLLAFPQLI